MSRCCPGSLCPGPKYRKPQWGLVKSCRSATIASNSSPSRARSSVLAVTQEALAHSRLECRARAVDELEPGGRQHARSSRARRPSTNSATGGPPRSGAQPRHPSATGRRLESAIRACADADPPGACSASVASTAHRGGRASSVASGVGGRRPTAMPSSRHPAGSDGVDRDNEPWGLLGLGWRWRLAADHAAASSRPAARRRPRYSDASSRSKRADAFGLPAGDARQSGPGDGHTARRRRRSRSAAVTTSASQ